MRNHGWELPYHPLQVVAVAVFVALAFAFYVFFVPFVGNKVLEFHVIAIYSPVVIAVFILYIKCAASNPADPRVLRSKKYCGSSMAKTSETTCRAIGKNAEGSQQLDATCRLSPQQQGTEKTRGCSRHHLCSLAQATFPCVPDFRTLCAGSIPGPFISDDDLLYCSLCEVEIFKLSKHCRVCDKCVDGFDHHCRWLNNCIGRKNYRCFIALMISSISMWSVGIWVVVHCFLHRKLCLDDIAAKLGSSFSLVPFIIVVASCTVLAMIATFPLAQLFCFHVLLIKKGISTYDYILAMREQEQQLNTAFEGNQTPATSPASSIGTALSGASSVGGMPKGAWCTPPHLFLDHKQAVLEPDKAFSSREFEPGATTKVLSEEQVEKKPAVKISPWLLARLNANDARRAAAQARNNSSIARPVTPREGIIVAETHSGIDNSSRDISTEIVPPPRSRTVTRKADTSLSPFRERFMKSWGRGKLLLESVDHTDRGNVVVNMGEPTMEGDVGLSSLQIEARNAFHPTRAVCASVSSSESSILSPEAQSSRDCYQDAACTLAVSSMDWPWLQRSTSDGYEASGGESDSDRAGRPGHREWSELMRPDNEGEMNDFSGQRVTGLHEIRTSTVSSMPFRLSKTTKGREARGPREKASSTTLQVGSSGRESEFYSAMESVPMSVRRSSISTSDGAFTSGSASMRSIFSTGS